jgi:hypothetical protein
LLEDRAISAELLPCVSWAAYLSAAATVLTFFTGILFFTVGQPFGTINDAASVFQMLFMLPLALALYQTLRPSAPVPVLLASAVGVLGMLIAATLQALLVFRKVEYEQTIGTVLAAGGAVGIWLAVTGVVALVGGVFPAGLAWLGILSGSGYVLLVVGFWIGGQENALFYIGSLVAVIGYSVWAIWLGRAVSIGVLIAAG